MPRQSPFDAAPLLAVVDEAVHERAAQRPRAGWMMRSACLCRRGSGRPRETMSRGMFSGTSSLTGCAARDHLRSRRVARAVAGLGADLAVDLDEPLVDEPLHAGAGEVADAVDEVLIDAAP